MWFTKYSYLGKSNWTEMREEALARGARFYYWGTDEALGFNALYNGDTYIFFTDINDLPAAMQIDAERYAKTL